VQVVWRVIWGVGLVVVVVSAVVGRVRKDAPALRAGFEALRSSWRTWLGVGHLALAAAVAGYLAMVGFNSAAYDYSFWNDPPPTTAADTAAVITLWVLALFVGLVAAATYGGMCELTQVETRRVRAADAVRAGRRVLPRAPIAVPAFALVLGTLPLAIPAAVMVAGFAAAPFRNHSDPPVSWLNYASFVRTNRRALFTVGLVVSLLAIPIDATMAIGFHLTANYDGLIQAITLLLIWLTFALASIAAGWASACCAALCETTDGRRAPT
jgi:hypothetical protein